MRKKNIIGVATIVIAMALIMALLPLQVAYANKSLQTTTTDIPSVITAVPVTVVPTPSPLTVPSFSYVAPSSDSSSVVSITDANLAAALVEVTGVSSANGLTKDVLAGISGKLDLSNKGIESLQGIEYLTNVTYLYLTKNPIYSRNEIKRLASLTNLEYLGIGALSISELPTAITTMTWLKHLDISANRLEFLPSSLANLNLESLMCNYCFFDVSEGSDTLNIIKEAATTANYQYQLNKLSNLTPTCQTLGTVVVTWEQMPDIEFGNGVKAVVKRYSISTPNIGGDRGSWLESNSASSTSYSFSGLDSAQTYSFDISVDYYITGTVYDGKYIKNYQKALYQPIPQDTPTPVPTETPTATPTATIEVTLAPTDVVQNTVEPEPITVQPDSQQVEETTSGSSSLFRTLVILVISLIAVVLVLGIVLVLRVKSQSDRDRVGRR